MIDQGKRRASREGFTRKDFLGHLGAGAAMATLGTPIIGVQSAKAASRATTMQEVVPIPVEAQSTGAGYTISPDTKISVHSAEAAVVADYLADVLRPSTGYQLPVVNGPAGGISLALSDTSSEVGP